MKDIDGTDFLVPLDLPGAALAFTTVRGEEMRPDDPYSGFSVCHYTGDPSGHYGECRRRLATLCGVDVARIAVPRQTHSTRVAVIDRWPVDIDGVDALVTTLPGLVIGVCTADCVPVVLCDPEGGVAAAVHAGWRGAAGGIVGNAVEAMVTCGADPSRIYAAMGPCISVARFEVGEEVAERFPARFVDRSSGNKPHVDLPGYVASQLMAAGVGQSRIAMPPGCSMSSPDRFFSARALGVESGRSFTFVMLP